VASQGRPGAPQSQLDGGEELIQHALHRFATI
jgi:hypothetical protein